METTLGFIQPDGSADAMAPDTLATMLKSFTPRFGGRLECVVLNGCCTASLASKLYDAGISTVIYWNTVVENNAATAFTGGFYRCLSSQIKFEDENKYSIAFIQGILGLRQKNYALGDPDCFRVVYDPRTQVGLQLYQGCNATDSSGNKWHGLPGLLPSDHASALISYEELSGCTGVSWSEMPRIQHPMTPIGISQNKRARQEKENYGSAKKEEGKEDSLITASPQSFCITPAYRTASKGSTGNHWVKLESSLSEFEIKTGCVVAADAKKSITDRCPEWLYAFGGRGNNSQTIERWKPGMAHWESVSGLSVPAEQFASVERPDGFIVCGGRKGNQVLRTCTKITTVTDKLQTSYKGHDSCPISSMTEPCFGMSAMLIDNENIAVSGGVRPVANNPQEVKQKMQLVELYDILRDKWYYASTKLLTPRVHHAVAPLYQSYQTFLSVGGLCDAFDESSATPSIELTDLRSSCSQYVSDLPYPKAFHSCLWYGHELIVIGGDKGNLSGTSEVCAVDLRGRHPTQQVEVPNLPADAAVSGHCAAALESINGLVLSGGIRKFPRPNRRSSTVLYAAEPVWRHNSIPKMNARRGFGGLVATVSNI
eukprot:gb/GECG01014145.1/.p1 GENE.gb/GECG01014145.1/~~gb/GECG01014145.1/.p1  ORF type:complete len:598 (+),score=56.23 gb/GECG01014145.1/:1-1794(+)